jgi:plasmid stabilization system protein ParE
VKLVWTSRARHDLRAVVSYIWLDDPAAARKMRSRIEGAAALLQSVPFAGRPGSVAGTREVIPHSSYRIVYELRDETVFILTIVHTSRQWPPVDGIDA